MVLNRIRDIDWLFKVNDVVRKKWGLPLTKTVEYTYGYDTVACPIDFINGDLPIPEHPVHITIHAKHKRWINISFTDTEDATLFRLAISGKVEPEIPDLHIKYN